ncbi:TMEM175 family protein [Streptomyces sp. t39]|uniref:TMEM175 family protein n=1 Tax=Streptomyces sp. t39 TaxID=1828156 RepID=UPI00164FD760|nr:TMEM175 family protein [Streptomyces sp. t39]
MTTGSSRAARPDRLITLSDGIFAIAMTLLALDVRVPPGLGSAEFHDALQETLPQLAAYVLSFLIVSIFWRDQRSLLLMSATTGGIPQFLALAVLGVIALVPFPTAMLAEYGAQEPLAVAAYAGTICLVDLLHLAMFTTLRVRHGIRDVGEWRDTAADLGATVVVFGASVPIAFLAPHAAMWCWLALLPVKIVLGRLERGRQPERET